MLTETQRHAFFESGFVRINGAIPGAVVASMTTRIWEALAARNGALRDDPSTWTEGSVRGIGDLNREATFRPFGNKRIHSIITSLLRRDDWQHPSSWGQILVTFPSSDGRWSWDSLFQRQVEVSRITWHTDYPYDTSPQQLAGVQIFGILADLEEGGGGTLVIKNSHRVIRSFVETQSPTTLEKMKRARLALMASHPWFESVSSAVSCETPERWLATQRAEVDGVDVSVAELTGKAGDVYFTHPWLLHAISPNCSTSPRVMFTQRIRV